MFFKENTILRTIIFSVATLSVFLICGEILIRLFYFGPDALVHFRRYEPIVTVSPWHLIVSDNPRIAFENRPNYRWYYLGKEVRTNRYGLVDSRVTLPEREGQKVIAMMGESYMEGAGVAMNQRVSALVEQKLRTRGDYAVLNMALTNTVLESQIERLKQSVLPYYHPDLVIVSFLASDNWVGKPAPAEVWQERVLAGPHWYPLWKVSFFLFVIEDYIKNLNFERISEKLNITANRLSRLFRTANDLEEGPPPMPDSDKDSRLRELLAELSRLGKDNGFKVVLAPMTHMKDFDQPHRAWAVRQSLKQYASELGMGFIDTVPFFDGHSVRACILWEMNRHPNVYANQIFAEGLYVALVEDKLL